MTFRKKIFQRYNNHKKVWCILYSIAIRIEYLWARSEPVIILTIGKTGSSSLLYSIRNHMPKSKVVQIHRLSQPSLEEGVAFHRKAGVNPFNRRYFEALQLNRSLRDMRVKRHSPKKIKVISLVREPVSCCMSAFFQTLPYWVSSEKLDVSDLGSSVQKLIKIFFREYPFDWPALWFDSQVKGELDIDIFDHGFDTLAGYKQYSNEHVDLLVLRTDLLGKNEKNIAEFLKLENFTLVDANVGANKEYADLYAKFQASINFSEVFLDRIYESRFVRTFFSAEEIMQFKQRYLNV